MLHDCGDEKISTKFAEVTACRFARRQPPAGRWICNFIVRGAFQYPVESFVNIVPLHWHFAVQ